MLTWPDIMKFAHDGNPSAPRRVEKTAAKWREQLAPEVYTITREKGTERPFSSPSCQLFEPGKYACVCCGELLFDASEKYDSGSGWPAFTQPANVAAVAYHSDSSHGMERVEITCNCCDSHLGHVFPDGPPPSGLRYCVNALSLQRVD
ncbi:MULTISPECIES: peptide-methionine (R)-S-oxide reductase MsrB [unclassified Pseudoalteromonas]|uniref:peptide-methionine (R)-S-oxide reductase MsrB n=1 Tax=unclassified Pseudoalteromonas TaxID=194690 RepID=UPI00301558FF